MTPTLTARSVISIVNGYEVAIYDWTPVSRSRTTSLLRASLVAALIAAGALIALPVGPIPVTLQLLAVAVAALVLSPAEAFAATALYLMLGAFGMPVFSGGGAGVGVLIGPTGGFLFGFMAGAPAAALVRRCVSRGRGPVCALLADAAAVLVLLSVTYAAGLAQFATVTEAPLARALAVAVAPFVLIDLGKGAGAVLIARGIRAAGVADAAEVAPPRVC